MTASLKTFGLVVVGLAACAPDEPGESFPAGGGALPKTTLATTPIFGGTVTLAGGGDFAVVSDPERDLIHVVDVRNRALVGQIRLPQRSQPTRGVEDGRGQVRVLLRGTGQVATVAVASATLVRSESVCPEPRGLTWDAASKALLVACAGGELVTLPAQGSTQVRRLDGELRDVLVSGGKINVSTFRSAELFVVANDAPPARASPPTMPMPSVAGRPTAFTPTVAWRTLQRPNGQVVMVHQRAVEGDIDAIRAGLPPVAVPYYRNTCNSTVVRTAVTVLDGTTVIGSRDIPGVLPVDAALTPDGNELVIVNAGNSELVRMNVSQLMGVVGSGPCGPISAPPPARNLDGAPDDRLGQPVGVAVVSSDLTLVHSRDPNMLVVLQKGAPAASIPLTADRVDSPGLQLFHTSTGGIACASCHPEGQEDGHVWTFFARPKRTQPLSGGLRQTAPYHWEGDLSTMSSLVSDTFVARMGGAMPDPAQVASLEAFLDGIPAPRPPTRAAPVDMMKGKQAFTKAGCDSCHGGTALTRANNADVGTGGAWQTPSLRGLALRGPWMHDGCAQTLSQRFTDVACGGTKHGDVSMLTATELDELVAYLGQL
ncbi:MAG: c-type cytochrome [Myxococcaceae bacterium]|jgi:DNA-binding beta-propeller fold protein YncE|nr:c-type cytochrome [Myxococcaceae bacterium]